MGTWWQPVSTAPREEWLLVCEHGFIYIGMFTEDGLCELYDETYIKPSHWMFLPDPPKR